MSQNVNAMATKIQALWRGYIYKMALPHALDQRKKRCAKEGQGKATGMNKKLIKN